MEGIRRTKFLSANFNVRCYLEHLDVRGIILKLILDGMGECGIVSTESGQNLMAGFCEQVA
jgi:hypothetical protein